MRRMLLAGFAVLTAAAQTQIDLRTQARRVDFTAATSTKPVKTGTALPGTCAVGEMFFKTDAPAGANLYGCTEAGRWSVQGGIPSQDCWYDSADSTLKCRDAGGSVYAAVKTASNGTPNQWVDYISPAGIPHTSQPAAASVGAVADPGVNGIPYRSGLGTATPANADDLSAALSCQDAGAVNAYACSLTPPVSVYRIGTSYWFKANTTNTGSASINLNGLGAKAILKQVNQQLAAGDIRAGQWVMVTYDGIAMQMQSQTANAGSGAVSGVFGRTGQVTALSGDYTTAQVAESGNLYFTNPRAQAAFSYPGVVKLSGGALDCPSCITASTPADTDLYGDFPHLSVVRLQGRKVAATQPADQQFLGWNSGAGQWEPKTLPVPPVNSIFGRTGVVTAQSGDYSFGQIAGAVAASQLPTAAMRTDASNTVTAGTQDMSGADHTLPMKSGPSGNLPGTCRVGETYFATDAPAGNNVYGCTAANTWSTQGTNLTVASEGTVIGWRPKTNFLTGPGLMSLMTDTGSQIDILWALDTAVVQTQPGEQSGAALLCAPASLSSSQYECSLSPTAGAYAAGMVLHWKPDVNGAGGATTLNVDALGAVPVKLRDGVSDPTGADIIAGQLYEVWYDGAQFRLMMPTASTAPGSVLSVFGRLGAITPQAGDYSTDQVAEGEHLYFTDERARTAVSWGTLAGKPSSYVPSQHAATHQSGGNDEIATTTAAPNAIPKAGSDGKISAGWLPASTGGLGYTAENTANKGQANGYASLDSGLKVPISQIPVLPYQPELGYTPESAANKGQANGYASLDSAGKVPVSQLPAGGSGVNQRVLTFDGSTTALPDGSVVSWTCGSGSGAQCTANWTVPAGVTWVRVQAWSGGGGGNGSVSGTRSNGGGGGGGYVETVCRVTPGASMAVAVGLGGKGGNAGGYQGDSGGNSSFGTCFVLVGAAAYTASPYSGPPGGYLTGGMMTWITTTFVNNVNTTSTACSTTAVSGNALRMDQGGCGANGQNTTATAGNAGGKGIGGSGGGGSGGYNYDTGGSGGTSLFGGNGGNGGGYTAGTGLTACTAGVIPGGGGGSAAAAATGGSYAGCSGARGEVRVFYVN